MIMIMVVIVMMIVIMITIMMIIIMMVMILIIGIVVIILMTTVIIVMMMKIIIKKKWSPISHDGCPGRRGNPTGTREANNPQYLVFALKGGGSGHGVSGATLTPPAYA